MKTYKTRIITALTAVLLLLSSCANSAGRNQKPLTTEDLEKSKELVASEIQALQDSDDRYLWGTAGWRIDDSTKTVQVNVSGNAALVLALREKLRDHPEIVINTPEPALIPSKRTISSPEESGIEATLLSYDSKTQTIGLRWLNRSGHDLEYGNLVALETEKYGVWNGIISNAAFTLEGYTLEDGQKLEYFGMLMLWGELPEGHYRYIREFRDAVTGKTYTTAIEFDQE